MGGGANTESAPRLVGKQMGSSNLTRGATLCEVPGKGLGLVATRDLSPGSLVVAEQPLLVLDPPTDRKTLLKTLGCDWCKVNMRAPPEAVRAQIQQLLVDRMVRRMPEGERETVMSFVDRAEEKGAQKTPWGVFLTNALPLGSYNKMGIFPTVARINHSCKPNAHHFYNPDTGEEEVWVVEAIPAGCEICISYIRTFCSRSYRQQLLQEKFGFSCSCIKCRLTGEQLQEDDRLRHEVDRLAQDFSLASKEESVEAIGIGEQMLELMNRLGFSPSVTWPGYLRLTELLLKAGDVSKAQQFAEVSYDLVCLAKGKKSLDASRVANLRDLTLTSAPA